ncbi:hypothetical protein ANN_21892 [Periplaneta americana]|uniref:MADF domain-containing protein n=1 Tax=Periplaneta americana TaxID=6978 RepID=A0ABQ8S740_PERAM|nr:hypothetical protein ANN_21892 [Periplaneta americana]
MAGLCEGDNESPGSLKAKVCLLGSEPVCGSRLHLSVDPMQEDRDITYALFCSVLCIMEQVLFDEILILSVEEDPHVYDKRRASYKDEKMKENTWLSIAASLNTDHAKYIHTLQAQLYRCCPAVSNNNRHQRSLHGAYMPGVVALRFLPIPGFYPWLFEQYGSRIFLLEENSIRILSENFLNSF